MSHITILEIPPIVDGMTTEKQKKLLTEIHSYLKEISQIKLKGVPRHIAPSFYTSYYILENNSQISLDTTTILDQPVDLRSYTVKSTFETKMFIKKDNYAPFLTYTTDWIPGINFLSFAMLNGSYPDRKTLSEHIPISLTHADWALNNMIIQGSRIKLIDFDDHKNDPDGIAGSNLYSLKWENKLKEVFQLQNPDTFKRHFWHLWRRAPKY